MLLFITAPTHECSKRTNVLCLERYDTDTRQGPKDKQIKKKKIYIYDVYFLRIIFNKI
jgi:hypothetical protein